LVTPLAAKADASATTASLAAKADAAATTTSLAAKADAAATTASLAAKQPAFTVPRTEAATVTLVPADSGGISPTPVACVVTVNSGLGNGFNRSFIGVGAVSFSGSAVVLDKRTVNATATPSCALVPMALDTYWAMGVKVA
jgi:hypothetical protein